MNYTSYIFAAYAITFVILGWVVMRAANKYKQSKRDLAKAKARNLK